MSTPVRRAGYPFELPPREADRTAGTSSSSSANRATRQRSTPKRPRRTARQGRAHWSMTHAGALVAGTMLIDERAATRGVATEGGDERAGARRALSVRDPVLWQPRSRTARGDWASVARPHSPTPSTANDAPLIAARAATRGRIATGGGDAHDGVGRARFARALASRTGSRGGNLDPLAATSTDCSAYAKTHRTEPFTRPKR
jgi:hypothetical protein